MEVNSQKQLYIVISQTGTVLSRILRIITGKEYNHASISLSGDLHTMYSFGRKNPFNPFWAGFVIESPYYGTFKRFSNTKIIVLRLEVSNKKYSSICNMINTMLAAPEKYHYNYLGLWFAAFNIVVKSNNRYYCSEFVREILLKFHIKGSKQLSPIIHPMSFLDIPYAKAIYCGKLSDYVA